MSVLFYTSNMKCQIFAELELFIGLIKINTQQLVPKNITDFWMPYPSQSKIIQFTNKTKVQLNIGDSDIRWFEYQTFIGKKVSQIINNSE